MMAIRNVNDLLPVKRTPPSGHVNLLCAGQKLIIVNFYKTLMLEQKNIGESQKMGFMDIINKISKTIGIKKNLVKRTLIEYMLKKPMINKKNGLNLKPLKQKILYVLATHERPTIRNILSAVNDDESLPNFSMSIFQKFLKHFKIIN